VLPIKDQSEDCLSKMGDATNDTFLSTLKNIQVTEIADDNFENLQSN
jgi:hypothetical protein